MQQEEVIMAPNKLVLSFIYFSKLLGQRSAGLSFNQGVGGSIPALVDVSLSKTLNPELLPVAESTVCECNMIVSKYQVMLYFF